MKVFVTGSRGIPFIPGGIETHCQNLYPVLAQLGVEIVVSRRSSYVPSRISCWSGVDLIDIYAPRIKGLEAIVHTFISVFYAVRFKADIFHIHGIGPALLCPIAKIFGLKVVLTHHGSDYERDNWGYFSKLVLKIGEKIGGYFADQVIAISKPIQRIIKETSGSESKLIFNGVNVMDKTESDSFIKTLGVSPNHYLLAVARFVPEKGLHDLINAFSLIDSKKKLVIAGDADFETIYSQDLKALASKNPNIILTGYITGDDLHEVYSHAAAFVLPSYHEGLPISLLEALSYGLKPLVSDISANKQVALADECFFSVGNVMDLSQKLELVANETQHVDREKLINIVVENYNWKDIGDATKSVYEDVLGI